MRIVGGEFRGRRLVAPPGQAVRPTSDRLRQTVFDILAHGLSDATNGAEVLDLFAGTGALGLEAMSRGAASCLFVDHDPTACEVIRHNITALGLTGRTRLLRRDATKLGQRDPAAAFDLVFADPPYGRGLGQAALAAAAADGWLASGALVILEEVAGADLGAIGGLAPVATRRIGGSEITFLRFAPTRPDGAATG